MLNMGTPRVVTTEEGIANRSEVGTCLARHRLHEAPEAARTIAARSECFRLDAQPAVRLTDEPVTVHPARAWRQRLRAR